MLRERPAEASAEPEGKVSPERVTESVPSTGIENDFLCGLRFLAVCCIVLNERRARERFSRNGRCKAGGLQGR